VLRWAFRLGNGSLFLGTQAIRYAKNVHMRWGIEHQFSCWLLLQIAKKFDLTKAEVLHLILLINSSLYISSRTKTKPSSHSIFLPHEEEIFPSFPCSPSKTL
jgi:hypothetical protein